MKTLVFIYNANAGVGQGILDSMHKLFSPQTYACTLCKVTYGLLGPREEWKTFLESLGLPMEFYHKDEWEAHSKKLGLEHPFALPAVLLRTDEGLTPILVGADWDQVQTLGLLQDRIKEAVL